MDTDERQSVCFIKNVGLEEIEGFIVQKTHISSADKLKYIALYSAIKQGYTQKVQSLLEQGIHSLIDTVNKDGMTLLHVAAYDGHAPIVQLLLTYGFDANEPNNLKLTALHAAAYKGHIAIVKLLLLYRANANSSDKYGHTPLHIAAHQGHLEILKLLLAYAADVTRLNNRGCTAFDLAAANREDIKLLLRKGAQIKREDDDIITIESDSDEKDTNQSTMQYRI